MKMAKLVTLIFLLLQLGAVNGFAQGAGIEWDTLNQEARRLYRAGKYKRAIIVAQDALKVAEDNVGPDHPAVATSLNTLALIHKAQGHYAKAEPLYKRSLSIREKTLGPYHPDVATGLNNLAVLYYTQGHYAKAEPLYKRSLSIRKTFSTRP